MDNRAEQPTSRGWKQPNGATHTTALTPKGSAATRNADDEEKSMSTKLSAIEDEHRNSMQCWANTRQNNTASGRWRSKRGQRNACWLLQAGASFDSNF